MDNLERDLLRDGTVFGPVTPELVAEAKRLCRQACKMAGEPETMADEFWPDFLSPARAHLNSTESSNSLDSE